MAQAGPWGGLSPQCRRWWITWGFAQDTDMRRAVRLAPCLACPSGGGTMPFQEVPEFLLECPRAGMLLLLVNVSALPRAPPITAAECPRRGWGTRRCGCG